MLVVTGKADRCNPAAVQQKAQRIGDLGRPGPPGAGKRRPGSSARLVSVTDAELARLSGRVAATGSELTAAERPVAELAARGLRNKDIASTLHLSVKTVETHLSRAYHKLGVSSRAELASRLHS